MLNVNIDILNFIYCVQVWTWSTCESA